MIEKKINTKIENEIEKILAKNGLSIEEIELEKFRKKSQEEVKLLQGYMSNTITCDI